jgi:CubicO group peptidase (beta-lactamase class C family)
MTVDGQTVVDLWGGFADAGRTRPWQRDTIVNVYSSTKTMTALTALLLADRGELDFAAPVARYWPEFAANGKDTVTVAHLMSHSAGLSGWAEPVTPTDLYDWDKVTGLLAAQAPAWEPPMRSAGLTELQRNASDNPVHDVGVTGTRAWRGAEIPAAGGTGNARSMAEIHAILANGGIANGRRFMSEAGCRRALEPQVDGADLILSIDLTMGLGFAVSRGMMPNPNTLYWGGLGGSLIIIDLDARTTMAYAMNRMTGTTGDMRMFAMAMAAWEAQGLL